MPPAATKPRVSNRVRLLASIALLAVTFGLTGGAVGEEPPAPIVLKGHTGRIRSVAFSPNGAILASSSYDGTVRWWNVADGKEIRVLRDQGRVFSLAFSPDGKQLAA